MKLGVKARRLPFWSVLITTLLYCKDSEDFRIPIEGSITVDSFKEGFKEKEEF